MTGARTTGHLVKLYPEEKERLAALAAKNGVSLSDAFRRGAEMFLTTAGAAPASYRTKSGRLLTNADIEALADEAERGYDVEAILQRRTITEDDRLLGELHSLASRIDGRIRGS